MLACVSRANCTTSDGPTNCMNVHEYQAKELLEKFGAATPRGRMAQTAAEAEQIERHDIGSHRIGRDHMDRREMDLT